jgi:hypothetical protein
VPNSDDQELTRRSIFVGAAALLICRPAIVRAASLMPIRQMIVAINTEKPWLGFVGTLRLHCMRQALERSWDDARDGQTFGGMSETSVRSCVLHMSAQGL